MIAGPESRDVAIPSGGVQLDGLLQLAREAEGVVVFVHGSGSSRFSSRNQRVASQLGKAGFSTLLFDLLTPEEEIEDRHSRVLRFDIPRLAERLTDVVDWLGRDVQCARQPIGLFGASTGAAAALIVAARRPERIAALVSRGGRPDLAGEYLEAVRAACLLIVGELDTEVLELNRQSEWRLSAPRELAVVPGATHLFEEGDSLDQVAGLARAWFGRYLSAARRATG